MDADLSVADGFTVADGLLERADALAKVGLEDLRAAQTDGLFGPVARDPLRRLVERGDTGLGVDREDPLLDAIEQ